MVLSYEALAEGVDADAILDRVLEAIPMPNLDLSAGRRVTSPPPRLARGAYAPRGPARPTPGALLRHLELTVRKRIDNLLAGDYRAWAFGDGAELAQVRPYELGDDVRPPL